MVVDNYRFGKFKYKNYSDIKDTPIKHSLPSKAENITLYKSDTGHFAKYQISKTDLLLYLNSVGSKKKEIINKDDFNRQFKDINWSVKKSPILFYGTIRKNGAGSTYYFDTEKSVTYQRTSYW